MTYEYWPEDDPRASWNDRDDYEASALEDRELERTILSALPALDRELAHKPAYTSNLTWTPDHLGLKTVKVTNEVVVTTKGVQLVCAACDAPFTIDQWLMRHWHLDGNLYHEECCDDE